MSADHSTPRCQCADCGVLSPVSQWGFVLLTREHGWTVTTVTVMGEGRELRDGVEWRCPQCSRTRGSLSGSGRSRGSNAQSSNNGHRASSARHNVRVLLVDDDALVRRSMARLIAHYAVVTAENALSALEILELDSDFDAVVSDVKMPGMSGIQFAALVQERWPELARRFVFVTGDPDEAEQLAAGLIEERADKTAACILSKPVTRYDLSGAIESVAGQGSVRSGTYPTVVATRPPDSRSVAGLEAK